MFIVRLDNLLAYSLLIQEVMKDNCREVDRLVTSSDAQIQFKTKDQGRVVELV